MTLKSQVPSPGEEPKVYAGAGSEDNPVIRRTGAPQPVDISVAQSILTGSVLGHLIPGAESCVIFFYDPIQQQLCPGTTANLSQEFIDSLVDKEREERLVTKAVEQAEPYLVAYLPGNNQFKSIQLQARKAGIRTLWLVPWYSQDGCLAGVVIFASRKAFSPGRQALATVTLLTELLSVGQVAQVQEPVETYDEHDEGIPYPFTIIGKETESNASRMQRDKHGIPVIYNNTVAQKDFLVKKAAQHAEPDAISVLSHELLSPLTLIKGYAATLLQLSDVITEEQSKQYLQGIQRATDRVIRLLENLRDISRLEIATPSLLLQPTSLPDLLRKTVSEIQGQTAEHVIKIRLSGLLPPVNVDRQKMEQVLTNLLTNAVKYSPQGGDIEVMVCQACGKHELQGKLGKVPQLQYPCIILAVSDSGIGLAEAELERIFERFYRVNNRLTRATSGAGLGLHICKIIVEAHGGRIWASSEVQKGSVFSFSIPVK